MYLGVFLLGFILSGTLCASWFWLTIFAQFREFSSYYLFKYFLRSFLSPPPGTPLMRMLAFLMLYRRSFGASLVVQLVKNPLQCRKLRFNS